MSSESYEENGYGHNLDLLIILHDSVLQILQEVGAEW
jgi:hypothetical protein